MIVQPDFLDHWKTNALAARIGRLEAITALLALWSHCQQRRAWRFPNNEIMIAGICRYTENPRVLLDSLLQLNLLEKVDENTLEVHEWAETNAKLLHNWEAGKKGGRPRNNPKENPRKTLGLTQGSTQGKPEGEPIREEKRREEITPIVPKGTESGGAIASGGGADEPLLSESAGSAEKKKRGARLKDPEFAAGVPVGYREPLTRWFRYKQEVGKGYTPSGWAALITQQRRFSAAAVAASVEASMANGWAGLFTEKCEGVSGAVKKEGARGAFEVVPRVDVEPGGMAVAEGPPEGFERAMAAIYGEDWESWAPSWFAMVPLDRLKVCRWIEEENDKGDSQSPRK